MKKLLTLFLAVLLMLPFAACIQLKAITPPIFGITSNDYSVGSSKINRPEKHEIETGETLRLYGIAKYGNDLCIPGEEDSLGWYVESTLSDGITWTSDDPGIASVDKNGTVIGIRGGKTVIRAEYAGDKVPPDSVNRDEYEIEVLPGVPFKDVAGDMWFYSNVKFVYEKKLMVGMEKDLFGPDVKLTRAMAVTVMFRLHQKMGNYGLVNCFVTDFPSGFEDVPDGAWYTDALNWARLASVVQGRTKKIFDPEGQITRAEFSAMLGRYLVNLCDHHAIKTKGNAKAEEKLTDWNKIPEFARNKVDFLFWHGLIKGKENGKFDPDAPITRAEIAAILDRTIRFTEENLIN